jgi:hypothetical protein
MNSGSNNLMRTIRRISSGVVGAAVLTIVSSAWAQVTINEFVDDERSAAASQIADTREFVELYNTGASTVDVSGWQILAKQIGANFNLPAGTFTYTLPSGSTIPAGGYFVMGAAGVPNVNFTPTFQGVDMLPDGANTTNGNYVLELRNTSNTLVDAVADETFRGTERANLTAEQVAQTAGGLWGQDPSFNIVGQNKIFSTSRYQNGRDTNNNGYDFGMLPVTPGASNNLPQNVSHTIPNVDSMVTETPLSTNYYASFVLPRVMDPTTADGIVNQNTIPASPQGGQAIMAYDESGGGNAAYSKELVKKFDLYAYVETGKLNQTSATDAQDFETTIYGIGTVDGLFGSPNPAGINTVTSSSNGASGYGWMIQRVENYNGGNPTDTTLLMLVDFGDTGDSIASDNEWQIMKKYDLSAVASGWHRLSIEYDPATGIVTAKNDADTIVFTESGDYNNDGVVDAADYILWRKNQATTNALKNDGIGGTIDLPQYAEWRAQYGSSSTPGLYGTFYVGYRENILDLGGNFSTARPPTYDMIGGAGAGSLVSAVPEPGTAGLALMGLFSLLAGRRRRNWLDRVE